MAPVQTPVLAAAALGRATADVSAEPQGPTAQSGCMPASEAPDWHGRDGDLESREATTLRIPSDLLAAARALQAEGESLNDLATKALADEGRRRQGLAVHTSIVRRREEVRRRTGPHPDAADLVRDLRGGAGRHE